MRPKTSATAYPAKRPATTPPHPPPNHHPPRDPTLRPAATSRLNEGLPGTTSVAPTARPPSASASATLPSPPAVWINNIRINPHPHARLKSQQKNQQHLP